MPCLRQQHTSWTKVGALDYTRGCMSQWSGVGWTAASCLVRCDTGRFIHAHPVVQFWLQLGCSALLWDWAGRTEPTSQQHNACSSIGVQAHATLLMQPPVFVSILCRSCWPADTSSTSISSSGQHSA